MAPKRGMVYAAVPTAVASLCLLLKEGLFSACNTTRLIQNLQDASEVVKSRKRVRASSGKQHTTGRARTQAATSGLRLPAPCVPHRTGSEILPTALA